jgi:hypothetical protein
MTIENKITENLRRLGTTLKKQFMCMLGENNWIRYPFNDTDTFSAEISDILEGEELIKIDGIRLRQAFRSLPLINTWLGIKQLFPKLTRKICCVSKYFQPIFTRIRGAKIYYTMYNK